MACSCPEVLAVSSANIDIGTDALKHKVVEVPTEDTHSILPVQIEVRVHNLLLNATGLLRDFQARRPSMKA